MRDGHVRNHVHLGTMVCFEIGNIHSCNSENACCGAGFCLFGFYNGIYMQMENVLIFPF